MLAKCYLSHFLGSILNGSDILKKRQILDQVPIIPVILLLKEHRWGEQFLNFLCIGSCFEIRTKKEAASVLF